MSEIGVVIPVYNGARYLAETVESVLAQTFADWELVIVDDGSTDGSGAVAAAFAARDPRIRLIRQPNGGVAAARNAGFHALGSKCEFIAFLDQDDIWYPKTLAILHALLVADPHATAAHGTNRRIDAAGQMTPRSERETLHWQRWGFEGTRLIRWPHQRPTTLEVLAFMDPIPTPGQVLIRWSALLAAGDFDLSLAPADDWDLWLRLARHGYLAYTETAVLSYRLHDANVSLQLELMQDAIRAVRRRHASSDVLDQEQRSLFVRGYVWEHWFVSGLRIIWALEHWRQGHYVQAINDLRHAACERYQFEGGRFRLRWNGRIQL